jgi:hypothetical protein
LLILYVQQEKVSGIPICFVARNDNILLLLLTRGDDRFDLFGFWEVQIQFFFHLDLPTQESAFFCRNGYCGHIPPHPADGADNSLAENKIYSGMVYDEGLKLTLEQNQRFKISS